MSSTKKLFIWLGIAILGLVTIVGAFMSAFMIIIPNITDVSSSSSLSIGDKIGILDIRGSIVSSEDYIDIIHAYRDDPSIVAVIMYIDSPGGGATATREIYDELLLLKQEKPLTVYMSSICASGGYFLASAADKVYSSPSSIIGSVGVIMSFTNMSGLFDTIGMDTVTIKSGEFKDIGSPTRQMTPEEETLLGELIDDTYEQFLSVVANGRSDAVKVILEEDGITNPTEYDVRSYLRRYCDGRVFTGRYGKDVGFVDELGNFESALLGTAEFVGIEGKPSTVRLSLPDTSLADLFFKSDVKELSENIAPASGVELKYAMY